jgi:hypothetical protein
MIKSNIVKLEEIQTRLFDLDDAFTRKLTLVADETDTRKLINTLSDIKKFNDSSLGKEEIKNITPEKEVIIDLGLVSTMSTSKKAKLLTSTNMTSMYHNGKLLINPDNSVVEFTNVLNEIRNTETDQYGLEYILMDANNPEGFDKSVESILNNPLYTNVVDNNGNKSFEKSKYKSIKDYEETKKKESSTDDPYIPGIVGIVVKK